MKHKWNYKSWGARCLVCGAKWDRRNRRDKPEGTEYIGKEEPKTPCPGQQKKKEEGNDCMHYDHDNPSGGQ
jgi:hypothetical protein